MKVAEPISGLAEIRAFGILCSKILHVHEAPDSLRFNEELLGG
ncbi:hypothetical protein [Cyanobium sp. ATX-6F1]